MILRRNDDIMIKRVVDSKIKRIYGFIPMPQLSAKRNAFNVLLSCPIELVNSQPSRLSFQNGCDINTALPNTLKSLLGLGSNFCPQPATQTLDSVDLKRFR